MIGLCNQRRAAVLLATTIALLLAADAPAGETRRAPKNGAGPIRAQRASYVAAAPDLPDAVYLDDPGGSEPLAAEPLAAAPLAIERAADALARLTRDLDTAQALEKDGNPRCVDLYFWTALRAWRAFAASPDGGELAANAGTPASSAIAVRQIYSDALEHLIMAGQRFKRLDPRSHLAIEDAGTRRIIPIHRHGLVWAPEDYCQLRLSKEFHSRQINRHFVADGWGARLVAVRELSQDEKSSLRRQPFAVTAVLRPTSPRDDAADAALVDGPNCPAALEFYNPRLTETIEVAGRETPLARDLTAPLALLQSTARPEYLEGFVRPDDLKVQPELLMLEPYQPGKIPVIFIHGLFSDPLAWTNAANELMAQGDLYRACQFWAFSYPTGGDLLQSAAALREDLLAVREQFDPEHADPAIENMMFITHSLGGLMGKLQITSSQDLIWNRMANVPLESLRADPGERARLAQMVYFEPVPWVRRVVFMGTPFRGSTIALRAVGRISSDLVRFTGPGDAAYRRLIDDNRGAFAPYMRRSRPTTVDMLEPDSPMLAALRQMPINPRTRLHTIIGNGFWRPLREPSDGIVAISSARHPAVESELYVSTLHTELHSYQPAIAELCRIVRVHIASAGIPTAAAIPPRREAADVFGD